MSKTRERTTVYLDPKIKKSVQYYALRDDSSLSEIINERLFEYLEDMADIAAIEEARKEPGDFIPLEQVVKELGFDIDEIRRHSEAERKKAA